MICFCHNDHDGKAAGAVVKYAHQPCKVIEVNYDGEEVNLPWEEIKDSVVLVVDYCFDEKIMVRLKNESSEFYWIDHHESSINKMKKIGFEAEGLLHIGDTRAACMLTWEFLLPDCPIPRVIDLISKYDNFDFKDPDVLPFHYALSSRESSPENTMNLWVSLINNDDSEDVTFLDKENLIDDLIEEGKIIQNYVNAENKKMAENQSFPVKFEGYTFIVLNSGVGDSKILEFCWDAQKYDGTMFFYRQDRKTWYVAIHNGPNSSTLDCGKIAAKYKGGGHADCGGFTIQELPFKI